MAHTTPERRQTHEHVIHVPDVLPIFPLPRTVLLPGEVLPLHIFEDRYREMVRDALKSSQVIGMVEVVEGYEDQHLGNPPIEKTGCVGIIREHEMLDDGRFLLWLFGLQRFEIDTELEVDTSYRQARVIYPDPDQRDDTVVGLAPMRQQLGELLPGLLDADDATRQKLRVQLDAIDDSQLIALSTKILQLPSDRKRKILEADNANDRFVLVFEDLYAALDNSPGLGAMEQHDLN